MRAALVGGFNKTKSLAASLIKKGYEVTAINNDKERCAQLAEIEKLNVFYGDGSKPFVLEDANVFNADIAIALTNRDDDNLVICELCKKKFSVKKTVALVSDSKKTDFFHRMGVDSVVCAITAVAAIIEQNAFVNEISTLLPIGDGHIRITQARVPALAHIAGKKLLEINLPKQVIIGCVMRGDKSMIPRGDTRILAGDTLVLISAAQHEKAAIRELTGK
ncbi:MAG: NAD-binding protein [Clostridiales bacterium]|jgi:trk system potassium uptake protein TrkA|nr:NAD-binding protein [Clostridiales bacterium]